MGKVYMFYATKTLEYGSEFEIEADTFEEADKEAQRRLKAGEIEWDCQGEGRSEVTSDDEEDE